MKFIDITPLLPKMTEINPAYQAGTIGQDVYRTAADVPTIVVPNVLLVRENLDANVACAVTKTVFEKKDDLAKANPAAKGISLETARKTDPVPLHRGAAKASTTWAPADPATVRAGGPPSPARPRATNRSPGGPGAQHRRRTAGTRDPRTGPTGCWSVRTQLIAPILVATVGLLVLGAVQTPRGSAAAADAEPARVLAGTATATVRLVHELERELRRDGRAAPARRHRRPPAGHRAARAGGHGGRSATARPGWRAGGRPPTLAAVLDGADVRTRPARRAARRRSAPPARRPAYVTLVEALLAVGRRAAGPAARRATWPTRPGRWPPWPPRSTSPRWNGTCSRAIFVRGALATAASWTALAPAARRAGAAAGRVLPDRQRRLGGLHNRLLDRSGRRHRPADARRRAERGRPGGRVTDGDAWYVAQSGMIRRYNLVGRGLSEQLDRQAAELAGRRPARAGLSAGVTVAVAAGSPSSPRGCSRCVPAGGCAGCGRPR